MTTEIVPIDDALFTRWLTHVFDHPGEGPEWFRASDAIFWQVSDAVTAACLVRAFETADTSLSRYSDAQVARGFDYLHACDGFHAFNSLMTEPVPWSAQEVAFNSIYSLFERCFAPQLSAGAWTVTNPLNSTCYMWWDIFPLYPKQYPVDPLGPKRDALVLDVMRRTLTLAPLACQEGAIHGLGHWNMADPASVRQIIGEYLARNPTLPRKLRDYAMSASSGSVL